MAIEVILREDVPNLGDSGEVVRVKPGYARNYLIPRGLAVSATSGNKRQIEHEKRLALAQAEKQREAAKARAGEVEGLVVTIEKTAGEGGKLYGSVTSQDIAEALKAQHGVEADRRKLQFEGSTIKQIGEYEVGLRLAAGVVPTFKLNVKADANSNLTPAKTESKRRSAKPPASSETDEAAEAAES